MSVRLAKTQKVIELRVLLSIFQHKVIHVDQTCTIFFQFLLSHELSVSLLIRYQQTDFIHTCHLAHVLKVILECLESFPGQFSVQAHAFELVVGDGSVLGVFVVEVEKASVVLLDHIAHTVERLDVAIWQNWC